jgi:NADPH2:quinone reductase
VTLTHRIRFHELGGPEVLRWEDVELSPPGRGEVRVRHTAVGLNFVDTYFRSGVYATELPSSLGSEAVGIVEAVGEGVDAVAPGDRVAYATGPLGAYSEARNMSAALVVKVPAELDDARAAASLLKGMTAHYLLDIGRVREEKSTILVHAAAGGVGLILCRWAKHFGATVIGTVGSEEKVQLARANGADHVIEYRKEDIADRVRHITGGEKADVVYDAVGKDTFASSLASLRARGMLVSYGQSSGKVPAFEPGVLASHGSLIFTRPVLRDYVWRREELETRARDLFGALASGVLDVVIGQRYPLRDAARAHVDLEARKTVGSTVLVP